MTFKENEFIDNAEVKFGDEKYENYSNLFFKTANEKSPTLFLFIKFKW